MHGFSSTKKEKEGRISEVEATTIEIDQCEQQNKNKWKR